MSSPRILVVLIPLISAAFLLGLPAVMPAQSSEHGHLQKRLTVAETVLSELRRLLDSKQTTIDELDKRLKSVENQLMNLQTGSNPLQGIVTVETGTINGVTGPHVIFTGVNVHIRSGSNATDDNGVPTGLGNLIVGYNEEPEKGVDGGRSGSHNIVVGTKNRFSDAGGFVAGVRNTIQGQFATVTGGQQNLSSGFASVVAGGQANTASGFSTTVTGGASNSAIGTVCSVSGGQNNLATGFACSISGGVSNHSTAESSSVSGGSGNIASGPASSVTGGENNQASGAASTVSGGNFRSALDVDDWVAGDLFADN